MGNEIDVQAICTRIVWRAPNSPFKIAKFRTVDSQEEFTVKGVASWQEGQIYQISAYKDGKSEKYADTYTLSNTVRKRKGEYNEDDIIDFLSTIVSENKATNLVQHHGKDILNILENENVSALTEVDGIGAKTAQRMIQCYKRAGDNNYAYIELGGKFNLTRNAISKVVTHFKGNVDLAIEKVNENPYNLYDVNGFGFKKADEAFLYHYDKEEHLQDPRRILAYIKYFFEKLYENGSTWATLEEFTNDMKNFIYQVDLKEVARLYNESDDFVTLSMADGTKRFTTKKNVEKEKFIAQELMSRVWQDNYREIENADEIILEVEKKQGWSFDEDQKSAINSMLNSNVFLLQGGGGVGKTSLVNAYSEILQRNNVPFSQVCLSGKASDNIRKITGYPASTIHSLIKYGIRVPKDYFPLRDEVIIIDEISMVDATIFQALLKAIKSNCKIIMIGDDGQLDSIGVGVMGGILESDLIPSMRLTKIHRQAQDSAIVTHATEFRNGKRPPELKFTTGEQTFGINQDLSYTIVPDDEEKTILKSSLAYFKKALNEYDINDIQIICATKSTGAVSVNLLNKYAQIMANSADGIKAEMVVNQGYDSEYILRVGDKVINTKNTKSDPPIYNGNTGILTNIEDEKFTVDFDGIGEVTLNKSEVNQIQLGYAITIHKSQGSTIKNVIIALPYHFMLNSRELLYTAVTRASKYASIITSKKSFTQSIRKSSKKIHKTNLGLFMKVLDRKENSDVQ